MRLTRSLGRRNLTLLLTATLLTGVLGAQGMPSVAQSPSANASTVRLERMLLLLEPGATKDGQLDALLAAQQKPGSELYHQWVTAAEFGQRFAPTQTEAGAVVSWLKGQGFAVATLPAGRQWVEFSGTAGQVSRAFGVGLTAVGGRYQATGTVKIPAAIAGVVRGLVSLDGTEATAAVTEPEAVAGGLEAMTTGASGAMSPAAAAKLLSVDAVDENAGEGETVAVPGRSGVAAEDLTAFRQSFGLPAENFDVSAAASRTAVGRGADEAALLTELSWAGVLAPKAKLLLVPAASTSATDGVDLALAATVDGELAHTVSVGYASCEPGMSAGHAAFYAAVYRQAAAEGIAVVAATGDSGAAGCRAGVAGPVATGYGVNALASTPWNTAVGAGAGTATVTAWGQRTTTDAAYATGGGVSRMYGTPEWQAAEGVPATDPEAAGHHRYLPDVVMPGGLDAAGRGLAMCLAGENGAAGCRLVTAGGSAGSAAMFAGLAAAVAGKYGAQGNLAPRLYALSRTDATASAKVVNDVTTGTARLQCAAGTTGCGSEGWMGYAAGSGYDLATGLGTVNAKALVAEWLRPMVNGTLTATIVVTDPPGITLNPSSSEPLTAIVTGVTGQPTPTGTVQFFDDTTLQNVGTPATLNSSGNALYTENGVLAVGGHNIEAIYSGDVNYQSGNSLPVTINVQPSTTTTVISASTTTPTAGQTITVTVTVSAANPGATPPTGTVNVTLNGISQGYAPISTNNNATTGTLQITIPGGQATYTLQGIYGGDTNYDQSTSSVLTLTLTRSATTTKLTASPSIISKSTPETLTAQISPTSSSGSSTTITGSVTFYDGANSLGTVTVNAGTAILTGVVLSTSGTHSLTAVYSGDTSWYGSTSPVVVLVGPATTTTVISPATLTPTAGATLTVGAVITGSTAEGNPPSGTLSITVDGVQTAIGSLSGGLSAVGNASVTVPGLSPGTHTLVGIYSGDSNYQGSTSAGVTVTVGKGNTTTTLTASSTVVNSSVPETLTATVAAATGSTITTAITGTVTFFDGTSTLGAATVNGGSAVLAGVILPTATTHTLTAVYSGDTNWNGSTSPVVVLQGPTSTTTVITPSATTLPAGSTLTVTGVVTGAVVEPSAPSGSLSISVDGVSAGVGSLTGTSNRSTAQVVLAALAPGSHLLVGSYSGDSYYNASTSAAVTVSVAKGNTVTTLAASPTSLSTGVPESLTATVAAATGSTGLTAAITGTVSFYDGTTLLGSATVASGTAVLSGVLLSNSATHTLTAVYSGDTNWTTSTSAALVMVPTLIPVTVTLKISPTTLTPGQTGTISVRVTPSETPGATAEQNPSGAIVFYSGTTIIASATLVADVANSSVATLPIPTLAAGIYSVTAVYAGDTTFGPGTSTAVVLDIEDFGISSTTTNITIVQGTTAQVPFTVTAAGGLTGPIEVVCAEQNPGSVGVIQCIFNPTIVDGSGQAILTIITTAGGSSTTAKNEQLPKPGKNAGKLGGLALAGVALLLWPIGRRAGVLRRDGVRRLLMLVLLLAGLAGAGLGCTSNTTVVTGKNGTPLGVHTLKITAAAYVNTVTVSRSAYLTVNVVPQ